MKKKPLFIILLLIVLSIPALLPLFHPGFFQTDDGEWMIIRLSAFYAALREGQIPVRFVERLNFGYGYPVAEFLYPAIMYFGSALHILKIGFVDVIKIIIGISFIGSTIFTYYWLKKFFSTTASIVGAMFALYVPYHLYDAYTRGSIGELFALIWVPFILWMIERKNTLLISIGISLLLLSHNTMALLFLPVLFIYAFLRKTVPLKSLVGSFALGLGLASFFILPAVYELRYTVFSQTAVSNPLEYFADPLLIGYGSLFLLVVTAGAFITRKESFKKYKSLTIFFFVISLLTVLFSTSLSSSIWQITQAGFIQFPFRLLSLLTVSLAFLAAAVITEYNAKKPWVISGILLVMLLYFAIPYGSPKSFFDKGEGFYTTNDATTTVKDEYMPDWVKEKPLKRPDQKVFIAKGEGSISSIVSNNKRTEFTVDNKKDSVVQVNTIYWPGWNVSVDGKRSEISYNNPKGVMQVAVPKGSHQIAFTFAETPLRIFADALSVICLVILGVLFYKSKRK